MNSSEIPINPNMGEASIFQFSFLCLVLSLSTTSLLEYDAKADNWDKLQITCRDLNIPQIDQFIHTARNWEKNEIGVQGDLGNLANNVCPAYLQNPNADESMGVVPPKGSITLQQYVTEQSRTFSNALNADSKGNSSQAYLMAQYKDLLQACARAQVNFGATPCGKYITERYNFITGELHKIKEKTLGVQKTCPQLASKVSKDGVPGSAQINSYGQGSATPTRSPAASSAPDLSTITGKTTPDPGY